MTVESESDVGTSGEKVIAKSSSLEIPGSDIEQGSSLEKNKTCVICSKRVILQDRNRYCRPCECELVVHINCALKSTIWSDQKCEKCDWPYRKTISDIRLNRTCFICQNDKYPEPKSTLHDTHFIRPCFCEMDCHHGCLANIIDTHKSCRLCGVKYRYIKYGSFRDYLSRYACQYGTCLFFFLIFGGSAVYSLLHGFNSTGSLTSAQISLILLGFVIGILALILCISCLRHTFVNRLPRFRIRYGQITILDYDPLMASYKKIRKADHSVMELSHLREERDDFFFGWNKSNHCFKSSTPLAQPGHQIQFSFDTPRSVNNRAVLEDL